MNVGIPQLPVATIALLVSGLLLCLSHDAVAQEDPEENWDALADTGNLAPHQAVLQALLEHRIIVLGHDVNANAVQQVVSSLLLLDQRDKAKPIHLYIRSNGGWGRDVFAIIGVIDSISAPVNTYAAGATASAGAMIIAAGTGVRTALPYSTISIHDNIVGPEQDTEPFSEDRVLRAKELAFWKRVAKVPAEWFKGDKDETYHLDPRQALEFGLIDVIAESPGRR